MPAITYQLKEKSWTFRDTYEIKDPSGNTAYKIKGKLFSRTNKFTFQEPNGKTLLIIKKRWLAFKPKYKIIRNGDTLAVLEKKRSLWSPQFKLDLPGKNDYFIKGEFWKREYEFEHNGKTVAEVSKNFWSWSDTFGVKIIDAADHELILATVVAMDLILQDLEKTSEAEAR